MISPSADVVSAYANFFQSFSWDVFCTFTHYDFSIDQLHRNFMYLSKYWINSPYYVFCFERQKRGAWHSHGMLSFHDHRVPQFVLPQEKDYPEWVDLSKGQKSFINSVRYRDFDFCYGLQALWTIRTGGISQHAFIADVSGVSAYISKYIYKCHHDPDFFWCFDVPDRLKGVGDVCPYF